MLFNTNNSIKDQAFVYTQLNDQTVLFQTIQFSISTQFKCQAVISIWSIDKTLSNATTTGQCGPGSDNNEEVLCIPHVSSITDVSTSDCLVSHPGQSLEESYPFAETHQVYSLALADWGIGHSLVESYPSAETHPVYSAAPADWANIYKRWLLYIYIQFQLVYNFGSAFCK